VKVNEETLKMLLDKLSDVEIRLLVLEQNYNIEQVVGRGRETEMLKALMMELDQRKASTYN
jgi:hypothetical protein